MMLKVMEDVKVCVFVFVLFADPLDAPYKLEMTRVSDKYQVVEERR